MQILNMAKISKPLVVLIPLSSLLLTVILSCATTATVVVNSFEQQNRLTSSLMPMSISPRIDSQELRLKPRRVRPRRATELMGHAESLTLRTELMPINEFRVSGSKAEPPSRPTNDWSRQSFARPYFGPNIVRNVSIDLGKTAYLTCKVHDLSDKIVSWLRPNRNEILTAGKYTYTRDSRFSSINDGGPDWLLEIKDVTVADAQNYECQISTDPKMSINITLHVKAARATIVEGDSYYGRAGSTIELNCRVMVAPSGDQRVSSVYWYHNGNLLNYASAKPTSRHSCTWEPETSISRLRIVDARLTDSGNYSCKPSTAADPASIKVTISSAKSTSYDVATASTNRRDGSNGDTTNDGVRSVMLDTNESNGDESSSAFQINAGPSASSIYVWARTIKHLALMYVLHVWLFTR